MTMKLLILKDSGNYKAGYEGFVPRPIGQKMCREKIAVPWSMRDRISKADVKALKQAEADEKRAAREKAKREELAKEKKAREEKAKEEKEAKAKKLLEDREKTKTETTISKKATLRDKTIMK